MKTRNILGVLAAALLATTGLLVGAGPAEAASSPCGDGYYRVGVYAIPESGPRKGTLEIYWNGHQNCALAYGYGEYYGKTTDKSVAMRPWRETWWDVDGGDYKYYAGPVRVHPHGCIDVEAIIDGAMTELVAKHCD
jgi:hypothetical protein